MPTLIVSSAARAAIDPRASVPPTKAPLESNICRRVRAIRFPQSCRADRGLGAGLLKKCPLDGECAATDVPTGPHPHGGAAALKGGQRPKAETSEKPIGIEAVFGQKALCLPSACSLMTENYALVRHPARKVAKNRGKRGSNNHGCAGP